jgi:hypothetical protein
MPFVPQASQSGDLSDNSKLTVVDAPSSSAQRMVNSVNLYNNDTVPATMTFQLNDNGAISVKEVVTLESGSHWYYSGPSIVLGTENQSLEMKLAAVPTTTALEFSASFSDLS